MLYLIKKLSKFEDIELTANIPNFPKSKMANPAGGDGMVGFLPVFDDFNKALEWANYDMGLVQLIEIGRDK